MKSQLEQLLSEVTDKSVGFAETRDPEDRAYAEYLNGTANGLRMALELLQGEPEQDDDAATPEKNLVFARRLNVVVDPNNIPGFNDAE